VVDTRPLGAETFWENYAATFRGDERALSNDTRQRIGNRPSNFPDDAWMLLDAARRLRPNILDQLRQARLI
jgi:phage major head subunit gpT-like protein